MDLFYTNTQIHRYTRTKIHKYTDTQEKKYTNTQILSRFGLATKARPQTAGCAVMQFMSACTVLKIKVQPIFDPTKNILNFFSLETKLF